MTRNTVLPLAAVVLTLFVTGCGSKNPEKEQARWDKSVQQAREKVAANPSFSAPLEEQMAKAEKAMEAAQSVADAKEQAKQMAAARKMLEGGLFSKLDRVKGNIRDVRKLIVDATGASTSTGEHMAAYQAAEQAKQVLAKVEEALEQGGEDAVAAGAVLNEASADLASVETTLRGLIRTAEKRERQARKPAGSTVQTTTTPPAIPRTNTTNPTSTTVKPGSTTTQQPPAPAALWKCPYCGGKNKAAATRCTHCGAARK